DRRPSYLVLVGPARAELFRRLTRRLAAAGLLDTTGTERSYEAMTSHSARPDWGSILEQKSRKLDAARWPEAAAGERWIVTDFWFDAIYRDALGQLKTTAASWREQFLAARATVLQPTLLVATSDFAYERLRRWLPENSGSERIGREVPLLWPGQDE